MVDAPEIDHTLVACLLLRTTGIELVFPTIAEHHLIEITHTESPGYGIKPQRDVLTGGKTLVVLQSALEDPHAHHHRRMRQRTGTEHVSLHLLMCERIMTDTKTSAVVTKLLRCPTDNIHLGMLLQIPHLLFEPFGHRDIITVHTCYQRGTYLPQTDIQTLRQSYVSFTAKHP